ncbi:MAG: enoyl-CoA hydratase/isomerase family protein [Rhodospirillaceae bacterium]
MTETQDVLFSLDGPAGRIHLNKPQTLNALTAPMCAAMQAQIEEWAAEDAVELVIVTGEGDRAFCAGGDVRRVCEVGREDPVKAREFFSVEYAMDAAIVRFPKPYVSLIDGIVMGGGLGISVNGRYRVMTEHVMAAMPETGIGLLPDVGATAFLNACPGRIGLYLGLTGARLDAADAIHAGFGTHFVPRERLPALLEALTGAEYLGDSFAIVDGIVSRFSGDPGDSALRARQQAIDRLFAADRVEDIVAALEADGSEFAATAAEALGRMSPTSMKIAAKQITENVGISALDALRLEYRMVCHVLERHDFYEGIRAALIDKDRSPKWCPATLDGVSDAAVDAHFIPLGIAELSLD